MKNNRKVKKAIITAAGMGTRFLPATKDIPKEMLPVVDKPILHYVVAECVEAGIEDIIIVIRPGNEAVMNYFTPSKHLEQFLLENGKAERLKEYRKIVDSANFIFVHQDSRLPYGNGSPILTAKNLVSDGPFVVCWGDDLVLYEKKSAVAQVVELFEKTEDAYGVMGVTQVPKKEVIRYGMVKTVGGEDEGRIESIVEKPILEEVSSNLIEFGRMVLSPKIFDYLAADKTGKDGELWLMDSIHQLLTNKPMYAKLIDGEFLTTGDPLRFLTANLKFALKREGLAEDLSEVLKELV
jgi:UTP--glucose-1-phosphate uridylyltransferase